MRVRVWVVVLALMVVASGTNAASAVALTKCDLRFDLEGWSIFYKESHGRGVVDCDNGQRAKVELEVRGGGITFGRHEIVDGKGEFSLIANIDEVFGNYASAEAHAGMGASTGALVVTKGSVVAGALGNGQRRRHRVRVRALHDPTAQPSAASVSRRTSRRSEDPLFPPSTRSIGDEDLPAGDPAPPGAVLTAASRQVSPRWLRRALAPRPESASNPLGLENRLTDTTSPWLALLLRRVPALDSLRHYTGATLRVDVVAGLSVAAVAVPQAMAYAMIAGLPAEYGLYTAIVMTAVGALLDSSRQLINGPTNAISIALLSAIGSVSRRTQRIQAAVLMAFLVGSIQLAISLLRLGDLTRYISHSVIVGFTAGRERAAGARPDEEPARPEGGRRRARPLPAALLAHA